MYTVIVDNKEVYSTNDKWEYIQYLIEHHLLNVVVRDLLPSDGYKAEFSTQ